MEQYFPKFPLKRSTSRGTPKFSKNFFPEVFFPFHFVPGISRIFGWRVRFSEIQQWNSGIFRYHLPLFPILRKFWLSGKRPFSFWAYPLFCLLLSPGLYRRFRRTVLAPVADQPFPLSSTAPFRNRITDIHSVHLVSSQLQGPCSIGHLARFVFEAWFLFVSVIYIGKNFFRNVM